MRLSSFLALILIFGTFVESVCEPREPHPLYKVWYLQKTVDSQKAFITDLLETLKKLDAKEGEVTALFLETLIREEKVMSPWIRDFIKSSLGRDNRLDHWIYSILIAAKQSKTVGDFMLVTETLNPTNQPPLIIKEAAISPRLKIPELSILLPPAKSPDRYLYSQILFPDMAHEAEMLDLIFDLGHESWEVRDRAFEELRKIQNINLKFLFEEMDQELDPEVKHNLQLLIDEKLPSFLELLELGSLEKLPSEDKRFIWERIIFPYLAASVDFQESVTHKLMLKLKELAIGEEALTRDMVDLVIDKWHCVQGYVSLAHNRGYFDFDFLSQILFSLSQPYADLRDKIIMLFEELYRDSGIEIAYYYLSEHRIPTFMVFLGVDRTELLRRIEDSSTLDTKRKLFCNVLMRLSVLDPKLWQILYQKLMDDSLDRSLKLDLIHCLYLRDNFNEAEDILTTLMGSHDFLITAISFKTLLDMCPTGEDVVKSTRLMFQLLDRFQFEPDNMARIFDLIQDSYICPEWEPMKPFLEHKNTHVRYKAILMMLEQYKRFNQYRTRFDVIQQYLPIEPDENIQRVMVEVLFSQNWLNINPSRYMCLFDYLQAHPDCIMKPRIEKFLTGLLQGVL